MTAAPIEMLDARAVDDLAPPCEAGTDHEEAIGCRGANVATLILWSVVCCPANSAPELWCRPCLARIKQAIRRRRWGCSCPIDRDWVSPDAF